MVIIAIVTEREITGEMISLIALSNAYPTILFKSISSLMNYYNPLKSM